MRKRLIVAANRLPVSRDSASGEWTTSPGGLVSALAPVLEQTKGVWVGWSGTADDDPGQFEVENITIKTVVLTQRDIDLYYFGFSNATIWPLYHDAIRPPEFHRRWWHAFRDVSKRFTDAILEIAEPGDAIWIHDYQLQLVPGMLRERLPNATIGFFLHIPFPPPEIYGRIPWRRQILEGVLGADVIGLQTEQSTRNLVHSAGQFTSASATTESIRFGERVVVAETAAIAIDTAQFEELGGSEDVAQRAEGLKTNLGDPEIVILGIDRLDYSKGIEIRLRALETLLDRRRDLVGKIAMVQVAVPSREDVGAYQEARSIVEEYVGRINGRFGTIAWTPVHYYYRSLDRLDLIALYRLANVMMVTPLRDGMNLVAKEYIAAKGGSDGVLILSEFAGAAEALSQALLVNPYDIDGLSNALEDAIAMPADEAKERMSQMRSHLRRWDVHSWARYCLERLGV